MHKECTAKHMQACLDAGHDTVYDWIKDDNRLEHGASEHRGSSTRVTIQGQYGGAVLPQQRCIPHLLWDAWAGLEDLKEVSRCGVDSCALAGCPNIYRSRMHV